MVHNNDDDDGGDDDDGSGAQIVPRTCVCVPGRTREIKMRSGIFGVQVRACQTHTLTPTNTLRQPYRVGDVYFGARALNAFQSVILFAQNHVRHRF